MADDDGEPAGVDPNRDDPNGVDPNSTDSNSIGSKDTGSKDTGWDDTGPVDTGSNGGDSNDTGSDGDDRSGQGPRTVVVPSRVYKSVTVFSTLFAVVTIVGGFVVLDSATERASVSLSEADPVLGLVGLALIALGAVTYAYSTRFKAAGMGNAKDDTDELSNDG